MPTRRDPIEEALAAPSRAEMRDALGARADLAPAAAARLNARLSALDEPARPLRITILRSYATELLAPWLELEARLEGYAPTLRQAPYGVLRLGDAQHAELEREPPDLVLVMARPEDLSPALVQPASLLGAGEVEHRMSEAIAGLTGILAGIRGATEAPILVTLLPRLGPPELGAFEAMAERPAAALDAALAGAVAGHLREHEAGVAFVDLRLWLEEVGRRHAFDLRLWHSSRIPFSAEGAQHLARHVLAAAAPLLAPPAKCIVLDADDTLWGGIVGEEGVDGIALGPEYPGSCYVDFQRRLLDFRRRGILLALVSKNEPADVQTVLRDHPHQVLREDAFAAIEVGWGPKAESVRCVAATLGIGTDALVFVDDSAHERHAMRSALPEVEAVGTPADPLLVAGCLDHVARLEVARLTEEDRRRPELYAQEAARRSVARSASSPEDYLRSLEMVMTVREDDQGSLARLAQLCQKTNQFNLTTRRHGEAELRRFTESDDALVLSFSLADVLGDSGIVGVAVVTGIGEDEAEVDTFLMSCRVIGRSAESAFLGALIDACARRGVRRLVASYVPTARNGLTAGFWPDHGFEEVAAGGFERDLRLAPPLERPPIAVVAAERALGSWEGRVDLDSGWDSPETNAEIAHLFDGDE